MSTDWKHLYSAALEETNRDKVIPACEQARRAIHDRAFEITGEMEELEGALRTLFLHQLHVVGNAQGGADAGPAHAR